MKTKSFKKPKKLSDRLLSVTRTEYEAEGDYAESKVLPREMVVSGDLNLGKSGNPVTVLVEDEVTGEALEINGVRSAFLIIEDDRKNQNKGWLAMAIGSIDKMESVLGFLSKTTLEMLRKFTGR